jgi:carbonic anhydrase
MVLGHSACGAVSAAVQSMDAKGRLPGHIQELVNAVKPAAVRVRNEKLRTKGACMPHHIPLISTLAVGLAFAFSAGLIAT